MGLQSVARDSGKELTMDIHTDSSAAMEVCNRKGSAKCAISMLTYCGSKTNRSKAVL